MVVKQQCRVNAGSVAKRLALRDAADQRKAAVAEAAREKALEKAWAVGADSRGLAKATKLAERASERDEQRAAKTDAWQQEAATLAKAPALRRPARAHSSDDLLGMALAVRGPSGDGGSCSESCLALQEDSIPTRCKNQPKLPASRRNRSTLAGGGAPQDAEEETTDDAPAVAVVEFPGAPRGRPRGRAAQPK